MTERGVVLHDVFIGDPLAVQIGTQDFVGGTRIDIVRPQKNDTFCRTAIFAHQVINSRNGLLVRRGTGIEHIARAFLAFILNRIEQHAVEFFKYRQNRFARNRGPATENNRNLIFFDQFTCLFGEKRPVRCRVNDHSFDLFAKQTAILVQIIHQHQDGVLERGFRNRHRTRKRVQHTDLDGICCLCG